MNTDNASPPPNHPTTVAPHILLLNHVKALRLPAFAREYEKVGANCAREGVDYPRYRLRLCEPERFDRERRTMERRIRLVRFPMTKSFDTFDLRVIPTLNKSLALKLARCEWIEQHQNIVALGSSGVGKTHTALALGLAACQKNYSVLGYERLTAALLDRLTHHVHMLEMNGESYRLATSKKRQKYHEKPDTPAEKSAASP